MAKGHPQANEMHPDSPAYARLKAPFPPLNPPEPGAFGSYFTHAPFPMPDLLTVQDIMAICQVNKTSAHRLIKEELPDYAVVSFRQKLRVHSWAMAHFLKMAETCPGCGQPWKERHGRPRRG